LLVVLCSSKFSCKSLLMHVAYIIAVVVVRYNYIVLSKRLGHDNKYTFRRVRLLKHGISRDGC